MSVDTGVGNASRTSDRLQLIEQPFLTRVRLRAQRRVLWARMLWSGVRPDAEPELLISHAEVDHILTDPLQIAESEAAFYETDPEARLLTSQIHGIDVAAAHDPTWNRLQREFALSAHEVDLLSLAVAVEVHPLLRRVYGYLHDDATACSPTPWLASSLFQWTSGASFGPESALVRWRLAQPMEGTSNPWAITAPWIADPYIVSWVIDSTRLDPSLGPAVQVIPAAESRRALCIYPDQLADMQAFVQAMRDRRAQSSGEVAPVSIEIELIGQVGTGKRTLAAQLCAALNADLLAVDASLLLGPDVPLPLAAERLMRAARMARLSGSMLYWYDVDGVNPRLWQAACGCTDLMLFGVESPLAQRNQMPVARHSLRLPPLTRAKRIALWTHATDQPVPEPVLEWMLAPAEIVNAARVAAAGPDAVAEACHGNVHQGLSDLFAPLVCPYTWDDIVLSSAARQHLAELEEQARLRWQVYEEWGFERLCPLGRGITALFAGPSGTGKTMAAQVVARSLGMNLYRVDLAGVMNKYIGETEKRLKQVFRACQRANVVLFFDEADALFGQRTQVKDAHDRFANIEIDYLLQQMEQFDGIAILATNRKGDLDKAFLRRIRFIVDFVPPGPGERLDLWRRVLPARSPQGEDLLGQIDWALLADKLNFTGADIAAAALGAAFLARAEGARICMKHILHAARREMTKHGVALRPGDWEG